MTGPNQDETPDPTEARPGYDEPRPDSSPAEVDTGADSTRSPERPDEAGAADERAALQDAALSGGSQESLLRLLGWGPGDPLPDDLLADGDALGVTGSFDGSPEDAADEAPYNVVDDAGLPPQAEPEPVVPINWNTLDAERAEQEWWQLDAFVYWLRDAFGLTPQELPPLWHRHTELVWELSALRTAWLAGHAEDAHPGSPLMWLRDLSDSRRRMRDWVQRCGTNLTEDRPTRRTAWPGEDPAISPAPLTVTDRAADFGVFVADDVARRRRVEAEAQAEVEQARAQRLSRLREAWHLPATQTDTPAQSGDPHEPGATDDEETS